MPFKSTVGEIWGGFCLVDFQKKSIILESKYSEVLFDKKKKKKKVHNDGKVKK